MPSSFGLIVEGVYDEAAISAFIGRLAAPGPFIKTFPCGGFSGVLQKFPAYLSLLESAHSGGPVDKAIVVVDSDGANPGVRANLLQAKIAGKAYSFPSGVEICVAVRELEAWLLADFNAVNALPANIGNPVAATPLSQAPEAFADPKAELDSRLWQRGITYSPQAARRIVAAADLAVIEASCPSFADFRQKIQDC
jgi:hypothetical protein